MNLNVRNYLQLNQYTIIFQRMKWPHPITIFFNMKLQIIDKSEYNVTLHIYNNSLRNGDN